MKWSDVKELIEFVFDNKDLARETEYYQIRYDSDTQFALLFTYASSTIISYVSILENEYQIHTIENGLGSYVILIPFELDELHFTLEYGKVPHPILTLCHLLKTCFQS